MRIDWSQSLETGNPDLDTDHRTLVDIINRLELPADHNDSEIGKILCDLIDYVIVHFGREEELMRRYRYPSVDTHMLAHCQFFTTLIGYSYSFETGSGGLSGPMQDYLGQWLLDHESTEDKGLAAYLRACQPE